MKRTILGIGAILLVIGIVIFALAFVDLPHTTTEPYQVPKSSDITDESFAVPPFDAVQRSATLTEGDVVHIRFDVTAGGNKDIDFFVQNDTTRFIADPRLIGMDRDWTVPSNGTYYFIYDNSRSWFTSKDVSTRLTRHWTETDYRDVTKYYPLFSYEFSYVGLILSLVGIGTVIVGFLRNQAPEPKS